MLAFIVLGAICGLLSALFVLLHRKIVEGERVLSQGARLRRLSSGLSYTRTVTA
jgi:hypothetical protein